MHAVVSIHFVDNAQYPIRGLKFKIIQAGEIWSTGITDSKGSMGNIAVFDTSETQSDVNKYLSQYKDITKSIRLKTPNSKVDINIISDNGQEKTIHSFSVNWGNRQIIVARSNWIKVSLPLHPNGEQVDAEAAARNETCGFAEVEYEVGKPGSNNFSTVNVVVCDLPKKIVDTALKHRGSTLWAYSVAKKSTPHPTLGNSVEIGVNSNKCSLFVYDVLIDAGLSVPMIEHGGSVGIPFIKKLYPPLAGDWADTSKMAANWNAKSPPLPGDVGAYAANYRDATGHVGIIIAPGVTASASDKKIEVNDAGFRVAKMTNEEREQNEILGVSGQHDFKVFRRHKSLG